MPHSQLIISRSNLLNNYNFFRSKLSPSVKLLALVKANAYGHGDIEVSRLLEDFGADYLGVAFPCEGVRLKQNGIRLPILVLTPGYNNFEDIVNHNLEPSITDLESLKFFADTLKLSGKKSYPIHIKIDSGMHRVGYSYEIIPELARFLNENRNIVVKSVFSHLGIDTEKLICLLLFPSKIFISFAHEENVEIIINNKNDTLIPCKNFLTITQSFLFSPREKRKGGRNI